MLTKKEVHMKENGSTGKNMAEVCKLQPIGVDMMENGYKDKNMVLEGRLI